MWSKVRLSLGCEKGKKTPTLSTNPSSYQQKHQFTLVLLAFTANTYRFVTGLKLY